MEQNTTKIFWRFYFANRKWADRAFATHYVPDQISGILYLGVTLFGYSILYSDNW